jgi:site-specific DNA-methyltransferase (adenine-specific)
MLDEQTGILTSGKSKPEYRKRAKNNVYGAYANDDMPINVIGDSGGASRFFYCSKASRKERDAGLEGHKGGKRDESRNAEQPSMNGGKGNPYNRGASVVLNNHPTVKPIDLNRWLASLLLPPSSVQNRRILVPFSGSGSEMIGCLQAGWDEAVGIEMDKEYCNIAEKRLKFHTEKGEQ